MTGKPVLAASASENVLFPDPASPVTMTRRPSDNGDFLIPFSVPQVRMGAPEPNWGTPGANLRISRIDRREGGRGVEPENPNRTNCSDDPGRNAPASPRSHRHLSWLPNSTLRLAAACCSSVRDGAGRLLRSPRCRT